MTESSDRLDRIEQMQESNNRFLVAFSASVESLRASVAELTDDVRNTRVEIREHRRQMREVLHRIDNNTESIRDLQADTYELRIENQRILRYLEGLSKNA